MDFDRIESQEPREFESTVADVFRQRGWSVDRTERGRDGGVDLEMRRNGTTAGVQVKHYPDSSVGRPAVQQYAGAKLEHGYDRFYVVTSGTFTNPAKRTAEEVNVRLVDRNKLTDLSKVRGNATIEMILGRLEQITEPYRREAHKKAKHLSSGDEFKVATVFALMLVAGGLNSERFPIFFGGIVILVLLLAIRSKYAPTESDS